MKTFFLTFINEFSCGSKPRTVTYRGTYTVESVIADFLSCPMIGGGKHARILSVEEVLEPSLN